MKRRFGMVGAVVTIGLWLASVPAATAGPAVAKGLFPTEVSLPKAFRPEGIAIGAWPTAYFGSLADGSIYQADLVTGRGRILSKGTGTPSVGLKLDAAHHRLFVAGGFGGDARVIDAFSGAVLASYSFTAEGTFVNDVVITPDAAWFTDSLRSVLYKLPLGRHGELPDRAGVVQVDLTGDMVHIPGEFNANGIATAPDGSLLIGQTVTAKLFRVDPITGVTRTVDLGGATLRNNDGMLREGHSLYVVQHKPDQADQLTKLELDSSASSARVVASRSDTRLDMSTTVAAFGNRFYLVNARFLGTPPPPDATYTAVAINKF